MNDDDLIPIFEDEAENVGEVQPVWRILVVDDDQEVHSATRYALSEFRFMDRVIEVVSAYSAAEARALLHTDRDFAVILLDVVMETQDAGLVMVSFIRQEMEMSQVRIIMRTGQPGYAPEIDVFNRYDINDYRTKNELTQTRLLTAISAAIRSYGQICLIADGRRGLEIIIHAAGDLMEISVLEDFSSETLRYLSKLLRQPLDGLVAVRPTSSSFNGDIGSWLVTGATGCWDGQLSQRLDSLNTSEMLTSIAECIRVKGHYCGQSITVLNLCGEDREGVVYLTHRHGLSMTDRELLGVFAANLVPSYGNVRLLEKLNYVAYHDSLTGLPNRSGFIRDLDHTAEAGLPAVVALVDLRHFSDLNDGLGHDLGNTILCAFAARLHETLGGTCRLARVGADVFGVIGDEAEVNPASIFEIFSRPLVVGDVRLPTSVTLGFCRLLGEERSGLALLKSANIALNRAKRSMQASYEYFVPEMEDAPRWRLEIIHRLREDFEAGTLEVWYQPKIAFSSGSCVGVEALLRWPAVGGGFVQTPDVFIPLAEYSGLIVELGDWVLEQACRAYGDFSRLAPGYFSVAVNVSMPQFRHGGFVARVAEVMARYAVPRGGLELEVTESVAMDEPKVVTAGLLALRQAGAKIAIDDFGTGYSSLAHLRDLPIDCLKIDRAFIKEISGGKGGMFAETIVALGQKLGMNIVAEGVETEEQAGFLRGMGCHMAQGFLYAKPMNTEALMQWLVDRSA